MSHQGKWECSTAIRARCRQALQAEKCRILDEFCQVMGYHRKAALGLPQGRSRGVACPALAPRAPSYGPRLIQVLAAAKL